MSQPDDEELLRLVQQAFDDEHLPAAPERLIEAAKALGRTAVESARPSGPADELAGRRVYRLERHMAAAAASASRYLGASLASSDGSVTTEVAENDEGHLTVTLRSADTSILYVVLAWTPITAEGVGRRTRLVTPLAPDRHGVWVRYDLGSVEDADAVDIEAAEPLALTAVAPADLEPAFGLVPTGASRRAWARAEAAHRAAGDAIAALIAEAMTR